MAIRPYSLFAFNFSQNRTRSARCWRGGQKQFPPLAWRPRQVDAFYGYIGAGVQTFGADGAGRTVILSAGLGIKF